MLKLQLQYFSLLMWRTDSLEKTLMLVKIEGRRRRGRQRMRWFMASLTQWTWVWASSGSWWWTGKPGVLQSMELQRVRHDWVIELNWWILEAVDWLWEECNESLVNKLLGWNVGEDWDVSLRITGNILSSRVKGEPWILEALRRQPGESSSRELSMLSGAPGCSWPGEVLVLLSKCLLVPF